MLLFLLLKTNPEKVRCNDFMKDYIIVTGGAGFVGSNLIELLIKYLIKLEPTKPAPPVITIIFFI